VGVAITIDLLTGGYDAADLRDRNSAEWPPHPARLFSALRAGARDDGDRAALRWLERQPPPLIVAADRVTQVQRRAYVVTNVRSDKGGSQFHPARTNGLRARSRALPSDPTVEMLWSGDDGDDYVAALDAMARRIPYLGRSTGVALVCASASVGDGPAHESLSNRTVYEPCEQMDGELALRVLYPGLLTELETQFEAGRPAHECSRFRAYRRRGRPVDAAGPAVDADQAMPSAYPDVIIFRFSGYQPHPQLAVPMTKALRSAVLRSAGDDAPRVLHGHGVDGRPHVAFLALPDVGHENADGHLLGLAVAVPELAHDERQAVVRAVLGLRRPTGKDANGADGRVTLRIPAVGSVDLVYEPGLVRPWGAQPDRWRRGSRRWVSATPVVLDRFPRSPQLLVEEIRRCLATVGLPEVVRMEISREPLLSGAARLLPRDLPDKVRGRLYQHVAVTFARRVNGPVLVGAGRYLGIGLLAPVPEGGDRE
jgi:CRISPR-associated protein Csb2